MRILLRRAVEGKLASEALHSFRSLINKIYRLFSDHFKWMVIVFFDTAEAWRVFLVQISEAYGPFSSLSFQFGRQCRMLLLC